METGMFPADDALAAAKAALRTRMLATRDGLDPAFRAAASTRLTKLIDDGRFRRFLPARGGIVAGFWPIRSEVDPRALMDRLRAEGYRLALPRVTETGLVFHEWPPGGTLAKGGFGLSEPRAEWPIASPDLFLTPLLAFDREGGRLGYGRGHYDRAFAVNPAARRVGLAFAAQEVETVPRGPQDARLEAVFIAA